MVGCRGIHEERHSRAPQPRQGGVRGKGGQNSHVNPKAGAERGAPASRFPWRTLGRADESFLRKLQPVQRNPCWSRYLPLEHHGGADIHSAGSGGPYGRAGGCALKEAAGFEDKTTQEQAPGRSHSMEGTHGGGVCS